MALLYGRAGRLTAKNGVFGPGQAVFHAAAQPGLSPATSDRDYERNNEVATQRLLAAGGASQSLEMLFYLSTSSVYGSTATSDERAAPAPTSTYGRTKLAAELAVGGKFIKC